MDECLYAEEVNPELHQYFNHVLSQMIAAYKKGADLIATIDDDNIPLDNWGKNLLVSKNIELNYRLNKMK